MTDASPATLLQLLTDAQNNMARLFEHKARHLGLTRPQWRVLSGLYGNDGMTQTELSDHIAIARSPLGKIIDQLERKGLIERHNDPYDRRINRLFVTEGVKPLVGPATDLMQGLESSALEVLDAPDFVTQLAQLNEQLRQMVRSEFQTISTA